jgi:hypothetical protein
MTGENVTCEICGLVMKTRINGSHLKRTHNISLDEYRERFPNAIIGKRIPKNISYECAIDGKACKNSSSLSRHLKFKYDMDLSEYYVSYILDGHRPKCKCGCGGYTSFNNMESGFHDYIVGHSPVWNTGLTKDTDERVKNMNSGGWNRGNTKEDCHITKQHSKKLQKFWKENPAVKLKMVEKYKQTMLSKYGVDNFSKSDGFSDAFKRGCLKSLGVENPYFSDKCKWKFKEYKLPSGKTVKLQGYENFAADLLLIEYDEHKIIFDKKDIPTINYIENGKTRRHKPDLFIPSEERIIEVKSDFTFRIHKENVFLKQKFAKQIGYKYEIYVFNSKGKLIKKYE